NTRGFDSESSYHRYFRCKAQNLNSIGFFANGIGIEHDECEATNCGVEGFFAGGAENRYYACNAHDNTSANHGFVCGYTAGADYVNCVSLNNNVGFYGQALNSFRALNCLARGNSSHGFSLDTGANAYPCTLYNCRAESNAGWGYYAGTTVKAGSFLSNCSGY